MDKKIIVERLKNAIQEIGNLRPENATIILRDVVTELEEVPAETVTTRTFASTAEEPKPKKYTKTGLKALNKKEQTEILEKLGAKKIPLFEKGRIEKILELQG